MTESVDYGDSDMTQLIEGDNNFRYDEGYENAGFTKTSGDDIDSEIFDIYEEASDDLDISDTDDLEEDYVNDMDEDIDEDGFDEKYD
ncbi:MAG: hypothetical protein GX379_09765 [Clostridiales bacterium]|nr:hypothetical protein [Clostridiales bacterium]